jgi:helicase
MEDMRAKMVSLQTDDLFQNHVSQITSKSILKELSNTEDIPKINWTYIEPHLQRNAATLSFILEEITLREPETLDQIKNSSLRLALLWENLSRLGERTPKGLALLNAASAYEIAGYQANSSCLSKIFQNSTNFEKSDFEILISIFFQRLFIKLREECQSYLKEPNFEDEKTNAVQKLGLAILASALINSTNFFLSGNAGSLEEAKTKIQKAEELFSKTKRYEEFNILHSLRSLLDVMKSRTTWTILRKYVESDFTWNRYLLLLARGLGGNLFNSPSISEFWPSQLQSIKNGLLESEKSKIIRMPTSSGKTRIAELAIVNALTKYPSSKCVYIAPYRALVSELEDTFNSVFADLGFNVTSILSYYENDPFESKIISDSDILITTPEKLDLILRSRPEFFENVSLFVLDECHVVNFKGRGLKIELLLTRLNKKFPNSRFLLLSAVLSNETMHEFLEWFKAQDNDLVNLDWKPTIKQHAKFKWTRTTNVGKLTYESRPESQLYQNYVSSLITHRQFSYRNPKTGRMKNVTFPSNEKNETAAELGFKYSQLGPTLIYAPIPSFVTSIAKALLRRIDLTKKIGEPIPTHFQNNGTRSVHVAEQWLGKEHEITELLKNGIAIHYGDLPDVLKRSIESDFREKNFQIIVATNTLSQGVNFPIRTVIIHSSTRYDVESRKISPIHAYEYWNLAGRAGRAGYETEGTVIHIINSQNDEAVYDYYISKQHDLEPIHSDLFNLLAELVNERISVSDLQYIIDPEVLGILAEESSFNFYEREIDEIISNSLVSKQARRHNISVEPLSKAFKDVASNMVSSIEDRETLKTFSNTGLRSTSCKIIQNYILENRDAITSLITEDSYQNIILLASQIFNVLNEIPEMNSDFPYAGDKIELLNLWISGKNITEIIENIDEKNTYNVTKFIESFFGYYAPWGVSSFIQIALKTLNVSEADLPNHVKYLPSIIKHGVPNSESSWAMQLGIPIKSVAINLANKYSQQSASSDLSDFVSWISKINSEDLINKFHLESPFLDDVAKTISRIGSNELLKEKRNLDSVIRQPTWIKGIMYENRRVNASQIKQEFIIDLVRDYENLYDRNAIKLFHKGRELGFIERHLAQYLAPSIDGGTKISAKVILVKMQDIPAIQIQLTKS